MKTHIALICAVSLLTSASVLAQSPTPPAKPDEPGGPVAATQRDIWSKEVKDRSQRGKLHDAFQYVRGDSGKWNDHPILQHTPALSQKPANTSLDDWADQLQDQEFQVTATSESWLLLRTRQLDDNDRVWVDRIERRGKQFTIVVSEAIWQGRYSKTFTYYSAFGVNLGALEPGEYEVTCIVKSLVFKQFEGDGPPADRWPKDEQPANKQSTEIRVTFSVVAADPTADK